MQFFGQGEGYVKVDGDDYGYVYQYTDHLGNVRLSYTDKNQNNTNAVDLDIVEENNYYPFGLKHKGYNGFVSTEGNDAAQRWKFGGKEYQQDMDLNWYDVSARNYDPALGRWMNIDPLADQMRRHSPYNYAFDNPIFFIDADGMAPEGNSDGYGTISETSNSYQSEGYYNIEDLDGNVKGTISYSDYSEVVLANGGDQEGTDPKKKKKKKGLTTEEKFMTLGLSRTANKLYGNPDESVLMNLSEEQKEIDFETDANKALAILMYEYASGTGDQTRHFNEKQAITRNVKWSTHARVAVTEFLEKYKSGKFKNGETNRVYVPMSPDQMSIPSSISRHLQSYFKGDVTFYMGGMSFYFTKLGNTLNVRATNEYKMSSGSPFRNESSDKKRGKNTTPYGTTNANFHFQYRLNE